MSSAAFIKFLPNEEILDLSKLEAFADDKLNITQKLTPVLKMVKHIVERGKMHFLLPVPPPPPPCFQTLSWFGSFKLELFW